MLLFFILFLFSMKHLYLLMTKTSPYINNSHKFWHGVKEVPLPILCILISTLGVWLRPQLNWCSAYMSHVILLQVKILTKISHRCFDFLFELSSFKMFLICYYLLPIFRLATLEKFVLIKKWYGEMSKIH